jgi:hypothetical protein
MIRALSLSLLAFALPSAAFAAPPRNFAEAVNMFLGYVQVLIPLIFALTFIVLSWGIVKAWILNDGNAEKVGEGRTLVVWGIIGLAVMSGLWGILALVRRSLFGF